ncbi:hypothetical protein Taro_018759 [Colocasia esculenta]|uniref:Secreted protein n=1 Tax=Colocasia esculenta TaxID=4460 RepID=A0A843UX62_COLES|nr:hypothetical protein [Colocasia esculenta]
MTLVFVLFACFVHRIASLCLRALEARRTTFRYIFSLGMDHLSIGNTPDWTRDSLSRPPPDNLVCVLARLVGGGDFYQTAGEFDGDYHTHEEGNEDDAQE